MLAPQHVETIRNLVQAMEPDPAVHALILGGSIAHGFAAPDSDVDVSIVVGSDEYQRRVKANELTYYNDALATYEGGYVDGKYVDLNFLRRVAATGSDPARFAYQDATILFSRLPELPDILAAITRYPVAEKEQRIYRFAAQLLAWQWHYRESVRKRSRYLELLALQKIVLFTCRIVLAANEMFFPFHKWMLRVTATATHQPPGLGRALEELMREPSMARVDAHVSSVLAFYGMDAEAMGPIWPTWFLKDTELAWLSGYPSIDDL